MSRNSRCSGAKSGRSSRPWTVPCGSRTAGFFSAGGSHSLETFVNQVARDVMDPQKGVPVAERAKQPGYWALVHLLVPTRSSWGRSRRLVVTSYFDTSSSMRSSGSRYGARPRIVRSGASSVRS